MKVYLAARYSRHRQMEGLARQLRGIGHTITSRWHAGGHNMPEGQSSEADHADRVRFAEEDYSDLLAADAVINFTEEPRGNSRGGRHVEFGMGYALGKITVVVGPRENVFHFLPGVIYYPNVTDLFATRRFETMLPDPPAL